MKSLWRDAEAANCHGPLALRVYTSNLLGQNEDLVLHGGGNTSVKITHNGTPMLYVKGSGWDLVSIQEEGFSPVKMAPLLEMATQEHVSDTQMVAAQREAMTDKSAPNPSVEAILHALIPYAFVDHTHADAVVTLSNSAHGKTELEALYPNFLIVPYVMPGFLLAKEIYRLTQGMDWLACEGIILEHHGIFTFDDEAKGAYEKMIAAVSIAERYLETHAPLALHVNEPTREVEVGAIKTALEKAKGIELVSAVDQSPLALSFAAKPEITYKGVLTPEHIIRTKRTPLVLKVGESVEEKLAAYIEAYERYFAAHAANETCLNPAPNYVVVEGFGVVSFGKSTKEAVIVHDIVVHTMQAVLRAEQLGGYVSIDEAQSFQMEYWELEQAKLKKA
jgi:rhamnose utilization protein RhaD (predicted bifunctional aldolase and dehydrogenase)